MKQFIPDWDSFINESTLKKDKQMSDEQHKIYTEHKLKFLQQQIDICKKHGVKCFVDFGTLLGIYRDDDLIRNDNDTDVQIFAETLNKDFFDDLDKTFNAWFHPQVNAIFNEEDDYAKLGWIWLEMLDNKGKKVYVDGANKKVRVFGDLMISYPYKDNMRILRWPGWETIVYDNKHASRISTRKFKGFDVPLPSDPEGYIKYFYGDDWQTPQQRFGGYTCKFLTNKQGHSYRYSIKENNYKL